MFQDALNALFPGFTPSVTAEVEKSLPACDLKSGEREKYRKMWEIEDYRRSSPGLRALPRILEILPITPGDVIGDFGCGSGRAALQLREMGHRVLMVDIADNCLNEDVRNALTPGFLDFKESCLWDMADDVPMVDWLICCDVLEHIPPERVEATLDALLSRTRKGAFLAISIIGDGFGQRIGETLHLTVELPEWWRARLLERFEIKLEIVSQIDFKVYVTPKGL